MSSPEPQSENRIRLVAGLGNPGKEYAETRHNVGFAVLDLLAADNDLEWEKDRKAKALVARRGSDLILVKPQTFMNLSGRFFKISREDILIVYDDVDTPLGKIKFKARGSAGGHNGIKSIIQYLGTEEFPRLKVGIGASGGKSGMVGHVLGKFEKEEVPIIEKSLALASESVKYALANNLSSAMNLYNRREKPKKEKPKNAEDNES